MTITENNAKACISMQRCDLRVAPFHNSREGFVPETSRPELSKKNRCSCSALAALEKIKKWDAKADENYAKTHGGRKSPVKEQNKVWEAVINLNSRHTMADVKKLTKKLEKITGYRAAQIAIHRDEGHLDEETGNFVLNVHAHVIFYARSTKTGLSLSTANFGRKDLMTKMQDAAAEELGMERGVSAEITGKKHLSPRAFKAQKRQEAALEKNNKEWEAKLEKNNAEWQAKMAERQKEWEQKQAEWEQKIPEIVAARERRSKFICEKLDWEDARTGKKLAYEMEMLGISFAGVSNPNGNILLEAQKSAIRNIFYMLGVTAQLAVFLMKKTLQNDEKLAADAKIFNVESTLIRAVDYVANSDPANAEELKKRIQRTFLTIPEDKREELFQYAIENAPTPELKADIQALIEGRFSDIAKSEAAQKRIENRDLRQSLREYSEEIRKIREELKAMDEENRILNLAERAILKEKGAGREQYAEQEAANRERLNDLKQLKDEQKALKKAIDEQREEKDAQTIRELNEKIAELNEQIRKITAENVAKQKELEAARQTAPQKDVFNIIDELEPKKIEPIREEPKVEQKQPEPVKPEKIEPEPIAKKDDFTNIYGYSTPKPEPRRRFGDDYERKIEPDRPKYEPIREPEKIEPEPFRDPWQEIENDLERWKKCESEVEKKILSTAILQRLDSYEKSGWDIPPHRQLTIDSYRRRFAYDPVDAISRERERQLEEQKRREAAELELEKKYDDVKTKNIKQEADARQTAIKKKRKDELEFGSI